MRRTVDAYYLYPAAWVGESPPADGGDIDLDHLEDEVFAATLSVGIEIKVLREGLFMFDFTSWAPGQDPPIEVPDFEALGNAILRRVQVMNAHIACLHSAVGRLEHFANYKMYMRPADRITMTALDPKGDMGFGDPRTVELASSRFRSTYSRPARADWRISTRHAIGLDAVEQSVEALDGVMGLPPERGLALVDLLLLACRALEDHNYALSLMTSWIVAERLLSTRWADYISGNRVRGDATFINGDRVDRLRDTRTFSAGVVAEILSLVDVLDRDLYLSSVKVRKGRNDWVHELRPISLQLASDALALGQDLLRAWSGVDLHLSPVLQLHG